MEIKSDDGSIGTYIEFTAGIITWEAYGSRWDDTGYGELNKENTRKLYEAMKEYYEEK